MYMHAYAQCASLCAHLVSIPVPPPVVLLDLSPLCLIVLVQFMLKIVQVAEALHVHLAAAVCVEDAEYMHKRLQIGSGTMLTVCTSVFVCV